MNGYRKSKGIVIELTALLDVILIMLFWVMMNSQNNMNDAVKNAQDKVAAAEQKADDLQDELDTIRDKTDAEIAHIWEIAENIDKNAADNQQALMGFDKGQLITLMIKYTPDKQLFISNGGKSVKADISSEEAVYSAITSALEQSGLSENDVVLCTLVYDSQNSLYKDVTNVKKAIDRIRSVYKKFYCAYINTSN